MKKYVFIALAAFLFLGLFPGIAAENTPSADKDVRLILKTDKGDIKIVVYASKTPVTAANFLNLAKRGYYNGISFHRVIPNFMVQTGDQTGTGRGTPGYSFENEIVPSLKHDAPGILSMANTGMPNSNGSQFFITHRATPHLDGMHTVFGKVLEGQDIVDSIRRGNKIKSVKFIDSPNDALKAEAAKVRAWNEILDQQETNN